MSDMSVFFFFGDYGKGVRRALLEVSMSMRRGRMEAKEAPGLTDVIR